ncbi:ABC transporter [Microbacterium caowuchunii]|uniref:ABC transporter n=1 Tax=Microbacterium caowuchunii TaxID=2614638 RepID=A0A5N0TH62_9MICO|nr:ABC transporter [Microbacterium caowuchunii]KAA9133911.1 ABC transporter [Microbacterium caowuchunii]
MSDQKTPSAGDPVDEPGSVDDVVGRANEGLAHAEAVRQDAVVEEDVVVVEETAVADPSASDAAAVPLEETVVVDSVETARPGDATSADTADDVPWYDRPESVPMDPIAEPAAETTVAAPAATPAAVPLTAPLAEPSYVSSPQPIFVQAPEAPRPQGNRGAAGAIGLLATLAFAVLYLAATLCFRFLTEDLAVSEFGAATLEAQATWAFWVPVVVFFLGFWLLGAAINRGRWGHWVIWGLLVGLVAYGGHLLGALFQAPFWELTARQGAELLEAELFAPLAIVAFVLGRELTIWFGAWVAARGRRVTELNEQAQREYERTLEAGPQLARA